MEIHIHEKANRHCLLGAEKGQGWPGWDWGPRRGIMRLEAGKLVSLEALSHPNTPLTFLPPPSKMYTYWLNLRLRTPMWQIHNFPKQNFSRDSGLLSYLDACISQHLVEKSLHPLLPTHPLSIYCIGRNRHRANDNKMYTYGTSILKSILGSLYHTVGYLT